MAAIQTNSGPENNRRPLPRVIAEFDREKHLAGFTLHGHLARTVLVCTLLLAGSIYLARLAEPVDWLLVILFIVFANFIEWAFHRYPMHRPMDFPPGARLLYLNHALIHHRAFLHNSMPLNNNRELGLVLMPWYTMLLVLALGLPVALLGWALRGPGILGIFYIMAVLYYMAYEVLHALYHTNDTTRQRLGLKNNRLFRFLRAHHAHHHRLDRMSKVNFNVTFPLADAILGTREQPDLNADTTETAEIWDKEMSEKEHKTLDDSGY